MTTVGIVMNGVTGRMGTTQHLVRSVLAIRDEGGAVLDGGERVIPEPVLLGRNPNKLRALAEEHGVERWSTRLDECLADSDCPVYFDAQTTPLRADALEAAIAAGKHVYCEKPLADTLGRALELTRLAREAGVKNGVVQDKLFLPGFRKLQMVLERGSCGRLLSVRGEFGYWVFEGPEPAPQRPSWNYRKEDGGGIVLDMFPHWSYLLENLVGPIRAVSSTAVRHIGTRVDEGGARYEATAEDAAFATFELAGGVVAQINASWAVRVHRSDLFVLQVDGTEGSAVAGLTRCWVQPRATTPRHVWNPDAPFDIDPLDGWEEASGNEYENAFKVQWQAFLRHVVGDEPFPWDFLAAAKGVQLSEIAYRSSAERRWLEVPELAL